MGIATATKNWAIGNTDVTGRDSMTCIQEAARIVDTLQKIRVRQEFSFGGVILSAAGNYEGSASASDVVNLFQTGLKYAARGTKYVAKKVDEKVGGKGSALKQKIGSELSPVKNKIKGVVQPVLDDLAEAIRNNVIVKIAKSDFTKEAVTEIANLLFFVGGQVAVFIADAVTSVAPVIGYVNDVLTVFQGGRTLIKNSYNLHKMRKVRHLDVVHGAADLVITAIERHYVTRITSGISSGAKGLLTLTLRAAADSQAGAGLIVGAIVACIDFVYHLVDRLIERILLRVALRQARKHSIISTFAQHANPNMPASAVAPEYQKFTDWFTKWLIFCPVLSAVVLQGAYGHKEDVGNFVYGLSTSQDSNCKDAVKRLKKHVGRYLHQHRDEYSIRFTSEDPTIDSLLKKGYA